MDIEKLSSGLENQEFTVDLTKLQILLLQFSIKNDIRQESILKRQIEIIEILKGKVGQELEDTVYSKTEELLKDIDKEMETYYYSLIQKLVE